MKMRTLLFPLVLLMTCLSGPVMASAEESDVLVSLEQNWIDLANTGDKAGLDAFIDDSYTADTPSGRQTKADLMQSPPPGTSQQLRNLHASVEGDHGSVYGDNQIVFPDGKLMTIKFVDKFQRIDGNWRVMSSYVTN